MTALPACDPLAACAGGPSGGCNENNSETDSLTAAAGAAAIAAVERPQFRYWVDELLWSQGRTATVQLEEVLDAMGGYRTGGLHKPLSLGKQPSPESSALTSQQLQQELTVSEPASSAVAINKMQQHVSIQYPTEQASSSSSSSSGRQHYTQRASTTNSTNSSHLVSADTKNAAAVLTVPDAAADSDIDSSSGLPGGTVYKRLDDHMLGYRHVRQWDFLWTKSVYAIKAARHLQPGQLVSAIAGLNCLTMKKRMIQTLRMALGPQAFNIVPLSFCIPEELPAWQAWLSSPAAAADTGWWMLKTGQDAGKGLRLVKTQHALQVALRPPKNPNKPQHHIKVAQQYITNPLLIQGRKFHLRLWMVVTSHSPLRAYLYNQGLVLFSSEAYDQAKPVEGVKPAAGHVTNYARNEDTWVWGLEQLQQQIGQETWQQLWEQMRLNTALTAAAVLGPMRAAHSWLQPSISNYGFQMLGLDYMVDEQMHPWLLEVNSAPSIMAVHNDPDTFGLIKSIKQSMLCDMMALVQHRILPENDDLASSSSRTIGPPLTWRQELGLELAHRGGFEPLMALFPLHQPSISWQQVDLQLQELLLKR